MKRYRNIVVLSVLGLSSLLLFAVSCRKQEKPQPEQDGQVRWDVRGVEGYSTKSLINNKVDIEKACTPESKGGKGQTIGIWADYDITIDGTQYTVENVFKGTRLYYNNSLSDEADTKWEYIGDPAYWVAGGKNIFRAYYPSGEVSVLESSSSAKAFVVESNTASTQRDLLLAFNSFDTVTGKYADESTGDMSKPVPFFFRHAMAAVKVCFRFEDGFYSQDAITSCWFENSVNDDFAITGMMTYGDGVNHEEGKIQWIKSYSPVSGLQYYLWKHPAGVPFSSSAGSSVTATAYSVFSAGDTGEKFTGQDGFLMIIPQPSTGNQRICFTTRSGGNAVFRIAIPKKTGTSNANYLANPDDSSPHKAADGCDIIPGWRYTYTIVITKTDAEILLGIAPWNKLDSSFNISF